MFYTNKDIPLVTQSSIVEWDIKAANVSIMEYYEIYPKEKIERLKSLDKMKREISVGMIMKKDKDFSKKLEAGFNTIIQEFIEVNKVPDDSIISIKRDAIFVKNWNIKKSAFGDCVLFVPKNEYTMYINLPMYEIYISNTKVDVKGINDTKLPLHANGMCKFFQDINSISYNKYEVNKYLKEFTEAYKRKELSFDMYRRFTSESDFIINIDGYQVKMDTITEDDIPYLDISYNYLNVILPTIQRFL